MPRNADHTTLLCLFHHGDQAKAALKDLHAANIPEDLISWLGGGNDEHAGDPAVLDELGVPKRDLQHLQDGLADGGVIVLVRALTEHVADVERIFGQHQAEKIDEVETALQAPLVNETAVAAAVPVGLALAGAEAATGASTFADPDERDTLPVVGYVDGPVETVLLVSEAEVRSGDADLALEALEEESLAPVEVVVVPDVPREPIRPMEPASRYRQVD